MSGYDLCTGWGTPAGQKLINALANPEPLVITPASDVASIGGVGGPFTVSSATFTLTNFGTNSLSWSVATTSLWLNVSPAGGTLTPGGTAGLVTASLNNVASNLTLGTYEATISFTNLNDNFGQNRQFTLAIIPPPTITQQPTNQAVLDGATQLSTVEVGGGLPQYYQWQYNSNNLTDGGNISGSTTTNLTINSAGVANVGTYSFIVSNAAGVVVSSNVSLSLVPSAPVIIQQPADETVVVKSTAQFMVEALGTKPIAYQWSLNGTNLAGATNAVLTLTNVQFSQAGDYAVTLTNIYGLTNSAEATLTVTPCDPTPTNIVSWWPAEGKRDEIRSVATTEPWSAAQLTARVKWARAFYSTAAAKACRSAAIRPICSCRTSPSKPGSSEPAPRSFPMAAAAMGSFSATGQVANTSYLHGQGLVLHQMGSPTDLNGPSITDTNWHHVAVTKIGGTVVFYVDGVAYPAPTYNATFTFSWWAWHRLPAG